MHYRAHYEDMFSMTCTHCQKTRLMNLENIISMHRSPEGNVADVRCHCGQTAIHLFPGPNRDSIDLNTTHDRDVEQTHAVAS
jgi:hypothetical protein